MRTLIGVLILFILFLVVFTPQPVQAQPGTFGTIVVHYNFYVDSAYMMGGFTFSKTKLVDTMALPGKAILPTDKFLVFPVDTGQYTAVAIAGTDTVFWRRPFISASSADSARKFLWFRVKYRKTGY
jgi:hypothetical protein